MVPLEEAGDLIAELTASVLEISSLGYTARKYTQQQISEFQLDDTLGVAVAYGLFARQLVQVLFDVGQAVLGECSQHSVQPLAYRGQK